MEKQRQAAVLALNPKAVVSVTDPSASVCTALCLSLENGVVRAPHEWPLREGVLEGWESMSHSKKSILCVASICLCEILSQSPRPSECLAVDSSKRLHCSDWNCLFWHLSMHVGRIAHMAACSPLAGEICLCNCCRKATCRAMASSQFRLSRWSLLDPRLNVAFRTSASVPSLPFTWGCSWPMTF